MSWVDDADPWLPRTIRAAAYTLRVEKEVLGDIVTAFDEYLRGVAKAVLSVGSYPDLSAFPRRRDWLETVNQIAAVLAAAWRAAFNRVTDLDPGTYEKTFTDQIRDRVEVAVFPIRVYSYIRQQITIGRAAGESARDIGRRVEALLSMDAVRHGESPGPNDIDGYLWRPEARTVSRTSTMAVVNSANFSAAARQSEALGEEFVKRWIHVRDNSVRATHRAAGGQTVGLFEHFTVGEAKLLYPCDPLGPAGEVINCRCMPLYLPQSEYEKSGA